MTACADLRVLFRASAGPRRGYGHLVRCRSLARALGVRPLVCLRGSQHSEHVALGLGCDVVHGPAHRVLTRLQPDLVIVDDPVRRAAAEWIAAARQQGAAVVSIHDLGIGCHDADLRIDGSVVDTLPRAGGAAIAGPAFAIVDPGLASSVVSEGRRRGVLVSLGGGPRARLALVIASEIARIAEDMEVRVAGGFVAAPPDAALPLPPNVVWLSGATSLADELRRAVVAVVGGGVSLYEACAVGTPAVGVPVVAGQRPTVRGFVRRGAALGQHGARVVPRLVAADVLHLLRHARLRRTLVRTARRVVDGRGAERAAHVIARLVRGR
jgi:spore coat polysaccharide biosynthesis predicted glycosyltransferase SpsG